jgi:3-dehydroquinate dehydratase II
MNIQIINGPNLNLLGTREPEIYGGKSFENYLEDLRKMIPGINFSYFQSNIEGEIIDKIHSAGKITDGIIINPGGYTHTSVAIADAISSIKIPVIEVHISNLLTREDFRHSSITGRSCRGSIMGLGLDGYRLAAEALLKMHQ